jgi:general secretion pathway protein A
MLAKPSLRQLAQRITVRYHLGLLSPQETGGYIRHRLAVAGAGDGVSFDPGAILEIHRFSGGTPRLINAITDKVLLAGYVYQTSRLDRRLVEIAAADLREAS